MKAVITTSLGVLAYSIFVYLTYPSIIFSSVSWIVYILIIAAIVWDIFGDKHLYAPKDLKIITPSYSKIQFLIPIILLVLTLSINLFTLFEYWIDCNSKNFGVICGLLPFTDPLGYITNSKYFIEFGEMSRRSLWRPFSHTFNATLLKITAQNIQQVTLIMTCLVSTSIFFAAHSIYKAFGVTTGVLMVLFLSSFYTHFNGSFATEPLGFLVGNLSLAFFVKGSCQHKQKYFLIGLFLLALAMNIRAGAMFIFPILIIYITYIFREKAWLNYKLGFIAFVIVFSTLSMNSILTKFVASPTTKQVSQGNLAYILYGLVKGGKDWTAIREDYPTINRIPAEQRTKLIYKYAYQEFNKNPLLLFKGLTKNYVHLIKAPFQTVFLFNYGIPQFLVGILFLISLVAVFYLPDIKQKRTLTLLLIIFIGILISLPFIMIHHRYFAATTGINCAIVAIGMGTILQFIKRYFKLNKGVIKQEKNIAITDKHWFNDPLSYFTILILCITFLGPIWVKGTSSKTLYFKDFSQKCLDGKIGIFRISDGSQIHLVANTSTDLIPHDVKIRDYKKGLKSSHKQWGFQHAKVGQYVLTTANLNKGIFATYLNLILEEDITQYKEEFAVVCLKKMGDAVYKASLVTTANYEDIKGTPESFKLSEQKRETAFRIDNATWNEFLTLQNVHWQDKLQVVEEDGKLIALPPEKGKPQWGDSGAASKNRLGEQEDGYIENIVGDNTTNLVFGLSSQNTDAHFKNINYGILLRSSKELLVFENGKNKGNFGHYQKSDIVRIERKGEQITYQKNGVIFYTSNIASTTELIVDVSFFNPQSSVFLKTSFD